MAIVVPILSQFNDKGIKDAIKEFKKAQTTLGKFSAVGDIFQGVGKNLTKNVTLPIVALGGAMALLVKEAMEVEASQHRLRTLLLNTGGASELQVKALFQQAEALEKVGVVSKQNIMVAQSQLATFDLQASTIAKLTPAILDYVTAEKGAKASADDFRSMVNGLAQAMNGNFASLTKTGFVLDDHTKKMIASGTESERAAAIVEVLNSTYKDFNKSLLDTPEGQLIKLQQEFSNLREELGKALIPVFNDFVNIIRSDLMPVVQDGANFLTNLVKGFSNLDEETRKSIIQFVGLVAIAGPVLVAVGAITKSLVTLAKVFILLAKSKLLIPIVIIALIGAFRAQSDAQYQLAKESGNAWLQIARVIELGIQFAMTVIQEFINGLMVFNLALDHASKVADNFYDRLAGRQTDSLQSFGERLKGLRKGEFLNFATDLTGLSSVVQNFTDSFSSIEQSITDVDANLASLLEGIENEASAMANATKATKNKKKANDELKKSIIELRKNAVDKLKTALNDAQSKLDETRRKYNTFKDSIKSAITGVVDFQEAGKGADFFERLQDQADKAKGFADKIKKLIRMGLSQSALQQVIDAGADAGGVIADQIIAGGADMVKDVNKLVKSVDVLATEAGKQGAAKFYNAGIALGEQVVAGLLAALAAAQAALDAAMRGDAKGASKANQKKAKKKSGGPATTTSSSKVFKTTTTGGTVITTPFKLAKGGLVRNPAIAMIGEAGPEVVIPLDKLKEMQGGNGRNQTVVININAGNVVGSKEDLLAFVQRGLREYDRRNGKLNINGIK
jgi:hypothetical protein